MAKSQGDHEELMRLPRPQLIRTRGMHGMQRAKRANTDSRVWVPVDGHWGNKTLLL